MLEYDNIDQKLHLLCQILARVTANFLPEKEDYSHTNLVFDPIAGRISSRWMENAQGKIFLAIDIRNSRFQWINDSLNVTEEIIIKGKTLAELETEIASALMSVGFESNKLSEYNATILRQIIVEMKLI